MKKKKHNNNNNIKFNINDICFSKSINNISNNNNSNMRLFRKYIKNKRLKCKININRNNNIGPALGI